MSFYKTTCFLLMTLFALSRPGTAPAQTAASTPSGVLGWISIEPAGASPDQSQMLTIAGRALALRPLQGRYSLEVKRHGKSGVSNSRQGGAIALKPGIAATLSQSAINLGPADRLDIELKIYVGDREVFSASVRSSGGDIRL